MLMEFGGNSLFDLSQATLMPPANPEPETTALLARMAVQPSLGRYIKIDNLIKQLKAQGIWSLLDCFQMYWAETQQQALLNWIGDNRNATANGPVIFTANSGLATDYLTQGWIDTGYDPSLGTNYVQDSAMFGAWSNIDRSGMTVGMESNVRVRLSARSGGSCSYAVNSSAAQTASTLTAVGLTVAQRTGASAVRVYRDGAQLGVSGGASEAIPSATLYIGRASGPVYQSTNTGLFLAGAPLSAGQHTALYNAIVAYRS